MKPQCKYIKICVCGGRNKNRKHTHYGFHNDFCVCFCKFGISNESPVGAHSTTSVQTKSHTISVWCTTDTDDEKSRITSYIGSHIVIFIFDVTHGDYLKKIQNMWLYEIAQHAPGALKALVGVNIEQMGIYKEEISPDKAREFSRKHDMLYFECSHSNYDEVGQIVRTCILEYEKKM